MRWECRPIVRQLHQTSRERVAGFTVWRGTAPGREIWLVRTGMGPRYAKAAARAVGQVSGFTLFLSTGCAGGLAADLTPGDLAVATTLRGKPGEPSFETDAAWRARICAAAERAALRTVVGPLLSSRVVLATAAAKRAAAACGSVAVEMEGAPIAACAAEQHVSFAAVRAILDTADDELPDSSRFLALRRSAHKPLAPGGGVAANAASGLQRLLAVRRMMDAAQRGLEKFFRAWLAA